MQLGAGGVHFWVWGGAHPPTPPQWIRPCGKPRRTVGMQPQNRCSVWQTFLVEPPLTLASRIPNNTKKAVVDA